MAGSFPSREEILKRLLALCDLSQSREEIADWALDIFDRHDSALLDAGTRAVLEKMAAADLDDWDEPYLYGAEDFKAWIAELSDRVA
jgi:hypothetical protein